MMIRTAPVAVLAMLPAAPAGAALQHAGEDGSRAIVSYRVSGDDSHALEQFARAVDEVIGTQFGSFATYASQARP